MSKKIYQSHFKGMSLQSFNKSVGSIKIKRNDGTVEELKGDKLREFTKSLFTGGKSLFSAGEKLRKAGVGHGQRKKLLDVVFGDKRKGLEEIKREEKKVQQTKQRNINYRNFEMGRESSQTSDRIKKSRKDPLGRVYAQKEGSGVKVSTEQIGVERKKLGKHYGVSVKGGLSSGQDRKTGAKDIPGPGLINRPSASPLAGGLNRGSGPISGGRSGPQGL